MPKFIITFGQNHIHEIEGNTFNHSCVALVEAKDEERARELFMPRFCFSYLEKDFDPSLMKYFPRGKIPIKADSESKVRSEETEKYAVIKSTMSTPVQIDDRLIEQALGILLSRIHTQDCFTSVEDTKNYLHLKLKEEKVEQFCCLWLNNRNKLISFEVCFKGAVDSCSVYPREIVRAAIDNNAVAVIFAHNHPSGCAEPSGADERITERLKEALSLIDVRVLDHFIIGDEIVSFAERGLL